MKGKLIPVGETWIAVTTHYKGFNQFASGSFDIGVTFFKKAIER